MAHVSPQQVSPGDEITADSVNVPINQIAAQINGNLDDTNISGLSGSKIANASIPNAKLIEQRGFKIGVIPGATLASTGNKSVTGVGFKPKMVRFTILPSNNTTTSQIGIGAMTEGSQYFVATWGAAGGSEGTRSSQAGCIAWMISNSTLGMWANYVSMDEDGFTINVNTANNAFDIAYEAYA